MEAFVCGHNGFDQLRVKSMTFLNDKLLDILRTEETDKNSGVGTSHHASPISLLSTLKDGIVSSDCINISFTWSRCITSIATDREMATLVTGFKSSKDLSDVLLTNMRCSATTDRCVLLTERSDQDKLLGLYDGMSEPFAVAVVGGNGENQTSFAKLQCLSGGHNNFYSVYDKIHFGMFEISEDSTKEKDEEDWPVICDTQVRICHIDCTVPIKEISCGKEHVVLLSNSGNVYSYGLSSRGQLGHGEIEKKSSPCLIDALDGLAMKAVGAGGWHSSALSDIGDLYVWGWNESGQLGLRCSKGGSKWDKGPRDESGDSSMGIVALPTCVDVPGDENIMGVACGSRHTVTITEGGHVYTCGWNRYGQLGLGDTCNRDMLTKVDCLTGCIKVFAGHWNSAFLCRKE